MPVLFVHGAGGYVDDATMPGALREALATRVVAPRFPDEDMSETAWHRAIAGHVESLGAGTVVVGHSFGGSIALRYLVEEQPALAGMVLLAIPDWGPDGWDVADYDLPRHGALPADVPVWLHHCRDDAEVPFDHLARHARRLPTALVREHAAGGHQCDGVMDRVAADLRAAGPGW